MVQPKHYSEEMLFPFVAFICSAHTASNRLRDSDQEFGREGTILFFQKELIYFKSELQRKNGKTERETDLPTIVLLHK